MVLSPRAIGLYCLDDFRYCRTWVTKDSNMRRMACKFRDAAGMLGIGRVDAWGVHGESPWVLGRVSLVDHPSGSAPLRTR